MEKSKLSLKFSKQIWNQGIRQGEEVMEGGTQLLGADKKDAKLVLELIQLFGVGQMGI